MLRPTLSKAHSEPCSREDFRKDDTRRPPRPPGVTVGSDPALQSQLGSRNAQRKARLAVDRRASEPAS